MANREKEEVAEKLLKREVTRLGGLAFKLKFVGIAGAPDRLILMPQGRFFFVELKRAEGGELENSQRILFPRMLKRGFPVHIVYGSLGVTNFIQQHLE